MGICESAPDEFCGHILKPEDAGVDREMDEDWHEDVQNAVCVREPKYDGLCVWHADTEEKTAEELVEARLTPDDMPWETDYVKEHLSGAILREIEFPEGFSFGGCILILAKFPRADLSKAKFPRADLLKAEFLDAYLGGAEFHDAYLLKAEFHDAYLRGARFHDAYLRGARFHNAELFGAEFHDADLRSAEFPDADLRSAEFPRANLPKAEFPRANLPKAEFPDADLRSAEFPRANLPEAEFSETNLRQTDLTEANLRESEFSDADLRDVTFRPAFARTVESEDNISTDPLGASLEDAQFEDGTDLRGADLSGARLYQTAFRDVRINNRTQFGLEDGNYGEKCRYDYDPNTEVSIDGTYRLEAAAWTYRRLESLFEENAMDERARNAHIRKEEAQRADTRKKIKRNKEGLSLRSRMLKGFKNYLVPTVSWHLHRHGESVIRLLGWSGLLIFVSGIIYAFAGIARQNPEAVYRITRADLVTPRAVFIDLINSWYFSIITFSTIGYGDFYPSSPVSRLLVGIESLTGALFIALFVFVLGRRVAR